MNIMDFFRQRQPLISVGTSATGGSTTIYPIEPYFDVYIGAGGVMQFTYCDAFGNPITENVRRPTRATAPPGSMPFLNLPYRSDGNYPLYVRNNSTSGTFTDIRPAVGVWTRVSTAGPTPRWYFEGVGTVTASVSWALEGNTDNPFLTHNLSIANYQN